MSKFARKTDDAETEEGNIIKINKKWRLSIVPMNVILQKLETRTTRETKEKVKYWDTKGYFSKIEAALQHLVELEIQTCEDLPGIIAHIQTLKHNLSSITKLNL